MKKIKIFRIVLSFILSVTFSHVALADNGGPGDNSGQDGPPAVSAPHNPGNTPPAGPPPNTCLGLKDNPLLQQAYQQCDANYQMALANYQQAVSKYQADKARFDEYTQNQNQIQTQASAESATRELENAAAKLQDGADRLKMVSGVVNTLGTVAIGIGTALIAAGVAAVAGILTAAVGHGLIWKGGIVLAGGIALVVIAGIVQKNSERMLKEKAEICNRYNTISTKILNCPDAKVATNLASTISLGTNTTSLSDVPGFDPKTGLCSANAPAECKTLLSSAQEICAAKKGGPSCLAGLRFPAAKIIQTADGKVKATLNGKERSFGIEDFASEASMVKAGFTPAQAKQFMTDANNPNGILAKNGINAKGELIKMNTVPMQASGSSGFGSGSGSDSAKKPVESMTMKKDEYGDVKKEIASVPASAEGLTKDYNGDTIGSDGDDLFKMMNRRYLLKQHQNIFIEQ